MASIPSSPLRRASALALVLVLCGCDLPRDPAGSTERIVGGTLRIGVVDAPGWTDAAARTGAEADAVRRFAATLGARPVWRAGSESQLMHALQIADVDLVVGAIAADSPWDRRVGMSRPFPAKRYAAADAEVFVPAHVWAVQPGENRFLLRVEAFLEQDRQAAR
ncbi:hypothetical protein [Coralloluteibacterium stylophorae]|uniref:Uncharacterized protein n=1 Tax=Coralloluteibacterium stylophorae TaxID=1776034 RepID=A0A8J8AWW4_9GAMM|nr:hypothetical protein [Coralloluteibacterium stylophorae]MBS7455851.1 hypothetical protein [Coralloluteibacterium stylophorae]